MRRRRGFVNRQIDEWTFQTPWVSQAEEGDRLFVVFAIGLHRSQNMQLDPDETHPAVEFSAEIKNNRSSPQFAKVKAGAIRDKDLHALRKKVQALFDDVTTKDWKRIILVAVDTPEKYKNEDTSIDIRFSYTIVEKAGCLYRSGGPEGYTTREPDNLIDGDKIVELPYEEDLEKALATIKSRMGALADKIRWLVSKPKNLRLIDSNLLLT